MAYAKFHADAFSDPKLLDAADAGAKYLHLLPWLILFARIADDEGRLTVNGKPAAARTIARGIPCVATKMVDGCLRELEELSVLVREDGGTLRFTSWDTRNGRPSDTPGEWRRRKQAERNRKRGVPRDRHEGHAGQVTRRRVTVTPSVSVSVSASEEQRSPQGRVPVSDGAEATLEASLAPDLPELSPAEIEAHEARKAQVRATVATLGGTA